MRSRARLTGFAPVALLPPAAFAVHQLRFMLAFGAGAGAAPGRATARVTIWDAVAMAGTYGIGALVGTAI